MFPHCCAEEKGLFLLCSRHHQSFSPHQKKSLSQIKCCRSVKSLCSPIGCKIHQGTRKREKKAFYLMVFTMSVHHPVLPVGADLQLVSTNIVPILGFSGDGTLCSNGCEHSQEVEIHLYRGKRDKRQSGEQLRAQAGSTLGGTQECKNSSPQA